MGSPQPTEARWKEFRERADEENRRALTQTTSVQAAAGAKWARSLEFHYPTAGRCRLAMPGAAVCRGIVQCYLLINKDDRADDCLTLLGTNHHPNFSSSFSVEMPDTLETGLHSSPCPRMSHVTRHGQWETGGHLSTHFLLLDKASVARHSLLFFQELWSLHYTSVNMCKLWTRRS